MALSYIEYTGNGSQKDFTFNKPYISTDHVKALVDGVATSITVVGSTASFSVAPTNGSLVKIYRETPTTPLVSFSDGTVDTADVKNIEAEQSLYIAQETQDQMDNRLDKELGYWDAKNIKIKNLADAVDSTDAVAFGQINGEVQAAQAAAVQAEAARDDANTFSQAANTSANNASDSAALSESWAIDPIDTRPEGSAKYWAQQALTGATTFADNLFRLLGNADATKKLAFSLSGLTTATTRTLTVQDRNGTIALTADQALIQGFRLTLTSGTPVTVSDVTGATTIYCCPYKGNRIALYDGSNWNIRTSAQFSLALGTLTSGLPYDVFCYDNAGTPTLEFTAWTNSTTRATALAYQDGVLVKSGTPTRRYLGTFHTTSTTATEDSVTNRYLWNYYHRVSRAMYWKDTGADHTYTTATWRQWNASTSAQINFVVGVAEDEMRAEIVGFARNASTNVPVLLGVGFDNTTAPQASLSTDINTLFSSTTQLANSNVYIGTVRRLIPTVGRHYMALLEYSGATGTTTWVSGTVIAGNIMG